MRSAVASDFHIPSLVDEMLVRTFAAECLAREVDEAILAGDIIDVTRDGLGIVGSAASQLWAWLGERLQSAGIRITYLLGNHDYIGADTALLARALYAAGFAGGTFVISTGPEMRGPFIIEHGNRFDPWCRTPGNLLTHLGEVATALDGAAHHVGLDLDPLDPTSWGRPDDLVAPLDLPTHAAANRWACASRSRLVFGHSHAPYRLDGEGWSTINVGALTQGARLTFALLDDAGASDLVRG